MIDAINATRLAFVWRSQAGSIPLYGRYIQLAPNGCPDIVGWMLRGAKRGFFVGIEVKLPGKKASDVQEEWQQRLRDSGCIAAIAWSVPDAINIVKAAAA